MKRVLFFTSLLALFLMTGCGSNADKSKEYFDQGYDFLYHSQIEEAIECFDKAIECDDDNYEAYYYRGCAYSNNFNKKQAMRDWEKAIEIKEDYADPYFNIGLYYRRQNDYSMACYYFKLAEKYGRENMEDYVKHCGAYE